MIDYAKGYVALALYILLTKAVGLNFWQVSQSSRPLWLFGAIVVLVATVYWRRAPERRSRVGRG